ncbi:Rac GTPase-activating protein 1 [Acipenser ruthenus]|uniref:Rac GTPase-activating protein 1 n=1 Tax=Acipenser ruthenus TaxID=7906 RepID=A0A662YTY0_ACIRT|nr:Rac GTPase-activating protein 1 [Acipenser ruthenus]
MGEAFKRELLRYTNSELTEFIQVVKHFEECRKKWLHTELELMKCRDRVFKMDLDKSALEVKLKHARNQVDVEMKKRHRAETDFEHLPYLIDLPGRKSVMKVLESSRSHTEICSRVLKCGMLALLSKQEGSFTRAKQTTVWIANEDSVDNTFNVEPETDVNPRNVLAGPEGKESQPHVFVSKTVIRPESCVPCGKRIRFGKMAVKCRDCRMVAHPECKDHCSRHCVPNVSDAPIGNGEGVVADFSPSSGPMIPSLVVQCVNEIEKRGLHETGIYRVPGCDRTVRELKEKYMRGKGFPPLGKVDDIHVVCGLLKDFLRKLKEPLVTFHLHKKFMDAGDILDDDDSTLAIYKAIQELPQPNKDTLAFLILHLQRVMKSPDCKMDLMNLSRVFGPTIVGHSMTDPPPMMIMRDTVLQPKVVALFLSLPAEYWNQIFTVENNHTSSEIDANLNIHNMENGKLLASPTCCVLIKCLLLNVGPLYYKLHRS